MAAHDSQLASKRREVPGLDFSEAENVDAAEQAALRRAIDEGDASGIAEGDVFARVRQSLGLPARS